MPNIALELEYDGSRFFGFQKQAGVRTIQNELECALSKFAAEDIQVITAGRTDTKVHAISQVVNFTTTAKRQLHGWVRGVNALLPDDIAIKRSAIVPDNFNARFSALSRTYVYYLCVQESRPGLLNGRVGWYYANLDIEPMQEACKILCGQHDFSSFRAADCQANTATRNMLFCNVSIEENNPFVVTNKYPDINIQRLQPVMFRFEFRANAFLYHMVRNLVGALLFVGAHKLSVSGFQELLLAKKRTLAPPTFMPDGLYLAAVDYNYNIFDLPNNII